jgi:hypothetical protein
LSKKSVTFAFGTAAALLVGAVPLWFGLRWLEASPGDVAQSILLFYTLGFLIWSAKLTRDMARAATEQTKMLREQQERARRPFVVIAHRSEGNGGWTYDARNVGERLAVNVIYLEVENLAAPIPDDIKFHPMGAISANGALVLPHTLVEKLNAETKSPIDRCHHVLLAEFGDSEWTATDNVIQNNGRLVHRRIDLEPTAALRDRIFRGTLMDAMRKQFPDLVAGWQN